VLVLASRQNELLLGLDFFERFDAEIKVRDRETRALSGGICCGDYSYSPALRRKLAIAYSRLSLAMKLALISAGHTASHS
jgi:hypothetical protein